jgi:hypothetical protein
MNIKYVLPIVFAGIAISSCTQTKPVAVEASGIAETKIAAPAVSVTQGSAYAGTASGFMKPVGHGKQELGVKANFDTIEALGLISGKFTADFMASDGKKQMAGEFVQTTVSEKSFSGTATVVPNDPRAIFKKQTGAYKGIISADGKTVSGSVEGTVSYLDGINSGVFTYKFDFLLPVLPAK